MERQRDRWMDRETEKDTKTESDIETERQTQSSSLNFQQFETRKNIFLRQKNGTKETKRK
jgi:hypothetical protein